MIDEVTTTVKKELFSIFQMNDGALWEWDRSTESWRIKKNDGNNECPKSPEKPDDKTLKLYEHDAVTTYTVLSENHESFAEVMANDINLRTYSHRPIRPDDWIATAKKLLTDDRIAKFLNMAQPGDILRRHVWDAGFLRYSEGHEIVRNGEAIAHSTWRVS